MNIFVGPYGYRRGLGRGYDVFRRSESGAQTYVVDSGLSKRQAIATVNRLNRGSESRRDPRRRSRTREEWITSLRWNINDAKVALKNAVDMGDWRAVEKYVRQIREMEPKLYRAESGQLGIRRAGRARMIGEEQARRAKSRYEERVRTVERRLRGQGFTGSVKDYAESLIATRGYDQQLLASIERMRPRRIRPEEDD